MPSVAHLRPHEQRPGGAGQEDTSRKGTPSSTQKRNKKEARKKIRSGCSIRSATADRDPSRLGQLESDRGCGGLSQVSASQHGALDGVAPTARNSHQINQRLPRQGRASHGQRERYLAKECVGSNRMRKERSQLPAATTTETNHMKYPTTDKSSATTKTGDYAKQYRYAATPMETAFT